MIEIKHHLYTASASPRKLKHTGEDLGKAINCGLISGRTYVCKVDEKGYIKVSGFFHFNPFGRNYWSHQPGFADAYFKIQVCQQFLKFTETFITKHNANRSTRAANAV